MKQFRGFMLIELLLALAVVALLAAVAVPGFTRAQERARVSRVQADFQTIATALESYAIDHAGKYPLHGFPEEYALAIQANAASSQALTGIITTPVAYLPNLSVTLDPDTQTTPVPGSDAKAIWVHRHYNYTCFQSPWNDNNPAAQMFAQRVYGLWRLTGAGPDGSRFQSSSGSFTTISYDPTNGAMSWGDIHRTQHRPEFLKAS